MPHPEFHNPSLRRAAIAGLLLLLASSSARSDIEGAGDVVAAALPLAGLAATVWYEPGKEGTREFVRALGVGAATTAVLKLAIDKDRPDGDGNDSFPSMHSTVAFGSAAFIQQRYGWKYGLPAYGAATFVGYSRVHADRHDWSDVAAGAAIGVLSSNYFTTRYDNVTVTPVTTGDYVGVSFSVSW